MRGRLYVIRHSRRSPGPAAPPDPEQDADGLADLFAPNAVIEGPFAGPPGLPARLEDYEVVELYQTQDPEVVIVEMRTKGTVTTTGGRSRRRPSRSSGSGT